MSAAVQISTNVEFIQANTTTNPGVLLLPSTFAVPGRILTIKDITGSFGRNPLTLSTITGSFENGANIKRLTEPFGYLTLASDGISKWYNLDGTSLASYTVSNLTNNLGTSTATISTANTTVSTLSLIDRSFQQASTIFARSTLLYLGSTVIGGCKVGPTQFLPVRSPFNPRQIANLSLWLDAADVNTTILTGSSVTRWIDKSSSSLVMNQATIANMPTLLRNFLNQNNVISFTTTQNMTSLTNLTLAPAQSIFTLIYPVGNQNIFFFEHGPNVNTTDGSYLYGSNADLFAIRRTAWRNVNDAVAGRAVVPFTLNTWSFCSLVNSNVTTATTDVYWSINGTQRATGYFPAGSNSVLAGNATNLFYLNPSARVPANNYFAELLIYNSALSVSQVQQIEGYFAWKWGLVANLPSSHPFKNSPP